MKRRDFLKLTGVSVLGIFGLTSQKITSLHEQCTRRPGRLEPISVDGDDYWIIMMHPRQEFTLRSMVARENYKHEQWVKRHNRWRQSRGEPIYNPQPMEVGLWDY